jgi:type VI secretion system secreted protein VgrG
LPELQDPSHPGFAVLQVWHLGLNNLPKPAIEGLAELLGDVPELLTGLLQELHAGSALQGNLQAKSASSPEDTLASSYSINSGSSLTTAGTAASDAAVSLDTTALLAQAQALGYANQCELLRADRPWRPLRSSSPRFSATQSAWVVGPSGSPSDTNAGDVYGDKLGRVRIRFHWQGQLADGDGSSSGSASCWVRVAQRSAGAGMGLQFLPRVGQEVLVQFLEGDMDRPIVCGALYNGQGEGGIKPTPGGVAHASGGLERATQQSQEQKNKDLNNPLAAAYDHRPSAQGNLVSGSASGAQGNSPAWFGGAQGDSEASAAQGGHGNAAAQWGIRTQEWGGGSVGSSGGSAGYNQLVFDDSDTGGNQQRIQFKTSQYASELNLGHLIHSADNYRGSLRGQGFELRSDAYGAVRAGSGLMFSTYAIQHNASQRDPAGDNSAALALLKQAKTLAQSFSQAAGTHASVKLASHEGSLKSNASAIDEQAAPIAALFKASATQVSSESLDAALSAAPAKQTAPKAGSTLPHSAEATLTLAAQGGLAVVAGQSLQFSNNETLSWMSGQNSQSITGGQLRIHSGQAIGILGGAVGAGEEGKGLTLIAAQDPLRYEAQSDEIKVQAKGLVNIQSANSHIDFAAAKKISLSTAAGANITIEGGNITIQCPGTLTVHASAKTFDGPTSLSREMNTWPKTKFDQRYVIRHRATNEPMTNTLVEITRADGSKIKAVTDAAGKLPIQKGIGPEELFIKILGKA